MDVETIYVVFGQRWDFLGYNGISKYCNMKINVNEKILQIIVFSPKYNAAKVR